MIWKIVLFIDLELSEEQKNNDEMSWQWNVYRCKWHKYDLPSIFYFVHFADD